MKRTYFPRLAFGLVMGTAVTVSVVSYTGDSKPTSKVVTEAPPQSTVVEPTTTLPAPVQTTVAVELAPPATLLPSAVVTEPPAVVAEEEPDHTFFYDPDTDTLTPAPIVEPLSDVAPVIMAGPTTRTEALALSVTSITRSIRGEVVNVVAWYGVADSTAYVFQRGDGTRALVMGADRDAWSYVTELIDSPCHADPFDGSKGYPATCPQGNVPYGDPPAPVSEPTGPLTPIQ